MKIKTDWVPEGRDYLTPGVHYKVKKIDGSMVHIDDDMGRNTPVLLSGCSHLDGNPWQIVEEREMIDFTKPVRTTAGQPVEIITTKGREPYPVVGYVDRGTHPESWTAQGTSDLENGDLENIPQKRSGWVVVHKQSGRPVSGIVLQQSKGEALRAICEIHGINTAHWAPAFIEWEE